MMIIDSSVSKAARLWNIDPQGQANLVQDGMSAPQLLLVIKNEISRIQPTAIAVVAGPGTFSAVRVGVIYANLLARWYRVPLFSLTKDEAMTQEMLQSWYKRWTTGEVIPVSYVAPLYDREPNITLPKP